MFYECPKCKKVFEGELETCPDCGQKLDYTLIREGFFDVEGKKTMPKGMSPFTLLKLSKMTPQPVNMEQVESAPQHEEGLSVVPCPNPDTSRSNGPLNGLFNFFWILFIGLFGVIENAIMGVVFCCTIIGIPAGIICFKFIPVIFRPAGRTVLLNYKSHPVLNTICFIFGGFESYIFYNVLGAILCVTIIGIPLGKQLFKISKFFLAPFGSQVVVMNCYTNRRNTTFDIDHFLEDIALEDRNVKLSNGETVTATDAVCRILTDEEKNCWYSVYPNISFFEMFASDLMMGLLFFIATLVAFIMFGSKVGDPMLIVLIAGIILLVGSIIAPIIGYLIGKKNYKYYRTMTKTYQEKLYPIATYYPAQRAIAKLHGKDKKEFKQKHVTKMSALAPAIVCYKERMEIYHKVLNSKQSRYNQQM